MSDRPVPAADAVPEPLHNGFTTGMTALDRARHGQAQAVRVLVVAAGDGGPIASAASALGYSVTVIDARRAAEELAQRHYHAALVDLPSLGEVGRDVLVTLQQATPATPSLVVDVVDDVAAADRWIERGADDYLCLRQLGPALLRGALESAVSRSRARELRRRLEHADRLAAVGTLAAGVAHEVNNPAAYLLMNLKTCRDHLAILRQREPPLAEDELGLVAEMDEMLLDNLRGVERIVTIVSALRSYARTEPDEIEQVDLATVCRDACDLIGNQLRQRARLRLELGDVRPVTGDARKLGQVVLNLLLNAHDALPAGQPAAHEVKLTLISRPGRVELTITDTGVGIPPHLQSRIFEPFFSTKRRSEGAGLGLVIVRDIVERFGGRVSVASAPGHGSKFTVVFPAEESAPSPVATTAPAPRSDRARILIIDDEVALTSAMRRQLRANHDVTVLNDPASATTAIVDGDFDVVLCDMMMPGTDGLTVLESVHRKRPDAAARMVLMTAGIVQDPVRDRVLAAGGQVLDKPVPIETLLGVIATLRGKSAVPVVIDG